MKLRIFGVLGFALIWAPAEAQQGQATDSSRATVVEFGERRNPMPGPVGPGTAARAPQSFDWYKARAIQRLV
jgi:hypothetical protein